MDKATLVEERNIQAGLKAIKALEAAGLPIALAAWLRLHESQEWLLYIASPDVETHGPIAVNRFIDRILQAINSPISLEDLVVTNTTNHFVNDVRFNIIANKGKTPYLNSDRNLIYLKNCVFDGVEVDEGVIYKVARGTKPSKEAPKPDSVALRKARDLAA